MLRLCSDDATLATARASASALKRVAAASAVSSSGLSGEGEPADGFHAIAPPS